LVISVPPFSRRVFSVRLNLLLFGHDPAGKLRCARIPIKAQRKNGKLYDCATGQAISHVQFEGHLSTGLNISISRDLFSLKHELYLKLDRRRIFFDEAGWLEIGTQASAVPEPAGEFDGELLLSAS
jgi:hypothetical protein